MITGATKPVRLPEAVTVRHGPVNLLSQFFLAADQYVRDRGVKLYVRHDMDELLRFNEQQVKEGNWYPLAGAFNPKLNDLTPENTYWICGLDVQGERVVSQAARLYRWGRTSLADHAGALLYGDFGPGRSCIVECETAHLITGNVAFGGALWIRSDYRHCGLGGLISHISRAYAMASWGVEWFASTIQRSLVARGMHHAYGYSDIDFAVRYPGSPGGDLEMAVVRQQGLELLARVESFVGRPVEEVRAA